MNVSLELTEETAADVARAAAKAGKDVPSFLEAFLAQTFKGGGLPSRSVAEILAPFRAEVEQSHMSDEQLDSAFTKAREQVFAGRKQDQR